MYSSTRPLRSSHVQIVVGFFLIVCSAASIKCEDSGRCSQRSNACHPGRNPQVGNRNFTRQIHDFTVTF